MSQSNLGSLSQSARSKQLGSARAILIFIGVLTVVVNAVFFMMIEKQIDDAFDAEIRKAQQQGMMVDHNKVAELKQTAMGITRLVQGGAIALGVVFIVLGVVVKQFPVPCTILGLVLYIGAAAVFGLLDPTTLAKGLIIKIIIVVALFKSVQAAMAYEAERKRDERMAYQPQPGFAPNAPGQVPFGQNPYGDNPYASGPQPPNKFGQDSFPGQRPQ